MKNFILVFTSLAICGMSFMCSCGNVNQNNVVAKNDVETTTTNEIKDETVKKDEVILATQIVETTAQKENINVGRKEETNNMQANNILVAYFSATGTTKKVAEKIAELTSADIYEIVPKNPYSDADLNWNDRNSRTSIEMDDKNARPEIGSSDIDLTKYNTIYIGYPIWWGDAPRIMSTFVEKYNFDGKKVIPFCTSGGSGIGRSGSNLSTLAGSGNFVNGERLNSSADTNSIQNFIDSNK